MKDSHITQPPVPDRIFEMQCNSLSLWIDRRYLACIVRIIMIIRTL